MIHRKLEQSDQIVSLQNKSQQSNYNNSQRNNQTSQFVNYQIGQGNISSRGGTTDDQADLNTQYSDQSKKQDQQMLPNFPNSSTIKQNKKQIFNEQNSSISPLSSRNKNKNSQLFDAVALLQIDIIENLIKEHGVSPQIRDSERNTPLHLCMQNFSRDNFLSAKIAKLLLDFGANPNSRNREGWCPIHLAARKGSLNAIKFAIAYNLPILQNRQKETNSENSKRNRNLTPTSRYGIDNQDNKSDNNKQQNPQLFNLKKKGGPNKWSLLHIAANLGHVSMLEFLYQINYDMTTKNILGQQAKQVAIHSLILHKLLRKYESLWVNVAIFSDDEMAQGIGCLNYGGVIDQVSNMPCSAIQEYQQQQFLIKKREMINEKQNVQDLKQLIEQTMQKKKSYLNSQDFSSLIENELNNQSNNNGKSFENRLNVTDNKQKNRSFQNNTSNKSSFYENQQNNNNQNIFNSNKQQGIQQNQQQQQMNNSFILNNFYQNNQPNSNNVSFISSIANNTNNDIKNNQYNHSFISKQSNQQKIKNDHDNSNISSNIHKKLINNSHTNNRLNNDQDFALDIEPENTEEDFDDNLSLMSISQIQQNKTKNNQNNNNDKVPLIEYKDTELTDHEFEECTKEEQKAKEYKFIEQYSQVQNSSNQMVNHQQKRADWNVFNQRRQKELQIGQTLTLDQYIHQIHQIQSLITCLSSNSFNNINCSSALLTPHSQQKENRNSIFKKSPSFNSLFSSNQSNFQNQNKSNQKIFDSPWLTPLPTNRYNKQTDCFNEQDFSELFSAQSEQGINYNNNNNIMMNMSKVTEILKLINYLHLVHLKLINMEQIHFYSEVLPTNIYILSEFLRFTKSSTYTQSDQYKKQIKIIPNLMIELFDHFINVIKNSSYYVGEENNTQQKIKQNFNETQNKQQQYSSNTRQNYHQQNGISANNSIRGNSNLTPQSSPFSRAAHSPHQSRSPFINRNRNTPNTPLIHNLNADNIKVGINSTAIKNMQKTFSNSSISTNSLSDSLSSDNENFCDNNEMSSLEILECLTRMLRLFEFLNCKELKQKLIPIFNIKIKSEVQFFESDEPLLVKERSRSFSPFSFVSRNNGEDSTPNKNNNRNKERQQSFSPFGRSNNYTVKEQYVNCHKTQHYSEKTLFDFEAFQTYHYLETNFVYNPVQQINQNVKQHSVSPQPVPRNNHQNQFKNIGVRQSKSVINSPKKLSDNVSPILSKNDASKNYFPAPKLSNLSQNKINLDNTPNKQTQINQDDTFNKSAQINRQNLLNKSGLINLDKTPNKNNYLNENNLKEQTNNQLLMQNNLNNNTNNQVLINDVKRRNSDLTQLLGNSQFQNKPPYNINLKNEQIHNNINNHRKMSLLNNYSTYQDQRQQNNNPQIIQQQNGFDFLKKNSLNNNQIELLDFSIDLISQKEKKINDLQRISEVPTYNIAQLNNTQNQKKQLQTFSAILKDQNNNNINNNQQQFYQNKHQDLSFINNNHSLFNSCLISSNPQNTTPLQRNGSSNSIFNSCNQSNTSNQNTKQILNNITIHENKQYFNNYSNNLNKTDIFSSNNSNYNQNQFQQKQPQSFNQLDQQKQIQSNQKYESNRQDLNNLLNSNNTAKPMLNIIDTNKMASSWLNSKQGSNQQMPNYTNNSNVMNQNNPQQNKKQVKNQQNIAVLKIDLSNQTRQQFQNTGPQILNGSNKQLLGDLSYDELNESKRSIIMNNETSSASNYQSNNYNTQPQQYQNQGISINMNKQKNNVNSNNINNFITEKQQQQYLNTFQQQIKLNDQNQNKSQLIVNIQNNYNKNNNEFNNINIQQMKNQNKNCFTQKIQQQQQQQQQNQKQQQQQQQHIIRNDKQQQGRQHSEFGEENVTDDEDFNDETNRNKLQDTESDKYKDSKELIIPFTFKQNLQKYQIM